MPYRSNFDGARLRETKGQGNAIAANERVNLRRSIFRNFARFFFRVWAKTAQFRSLTCVCASDRSANLKVAPR